MTIPTATKAGTLERAEASAFRKRAQQAFNGAAEGLILKAHSCAVQRLGSELEEHMRAADVLLQQHADPLVITAALLAPLREQGCIHFEEARALFGTVPAILAERAISQPPLRTHGERHRTEDTRAFLESISKDLRGTILKLGLRLAELERMADREGDEDHTIVKETLELYVPLADWIGMRVLRKRLEDVCFRILKPEYYAALARRVEPIQAEDRICLVLLTASVRGLLDQHRIVGTVHGRTKSLYSLYRKMRRLDCALEQIMDRIGLRVIVSSTDACYEVCRLLRTRFRPVPGTLDDYIAHPKANGYQSLHLCVYPVPDLSYKPVEFQIRTEQMHQQAEFGLAAHWLYKSAEEAMSEGAARLEWLRGLLDSYPNSVDHAAFVRHLHEQVFDDRPVIFDEGGQAVRLPAGATIDDLQWVKLPDRVVEGTSVTRSTNGVGQDA